MYTLSIRSVLNYVPRMPFCSTYLTCLCVLRAWRAFIFLRAFRAFIFLCALHALIFLRILIFLRALRVFIYLRALCTLIFRCLRCLHCLTCLKCLHFYKPYMPSFLRALRTPIVFTWLTWLYFHTCLLALTFSSVSNFYCVLRAFAFLYKTWYNPEPTTTSWYKQERGRINGK